MRSSGFVAAGRRLTASQTLAWAALLLLTGLAALRPMRSINAWVLTHWTFTYEHGFLKRALVGEIVSRLFGPASAGTVTALSAGMALLLVLALVRWFAEPAIREQSMGAWLFVFVAATHSATIPNLIYDAGRFDQIGMLILLGCMLALGRGTPIWRLIVVAAACVIGLLVHEAFAIMFLPLIMAIWHFEDAGERQGSRIVVLASVLLLAWAIGNHGRMTALPMDQFVAQLQDRHAFPIRNSSVLVLYTDFRYDVTATMPALFRRWQMLNHAILALILLPTLLLFSRLSRAVCGPGTAMPVRRRCWLVLFAACSPLALYAVGVDVSRWWALTVTNLFIAVVYLAVRSGATHALAEVIERNALLTAAIAGISLVAGPVGIMQAYPLFEGLWFVSHPLFDGLWSGVDWLSEAR